MPFQVYLCTDGYARTASNAMDFSQDQLRNPYAHLCNNAVQKHGPGYGSAEDGNQLSFAGLEKLLRQEGHDVDIRKDWYPRMKELVRAESACACSYSSVRRDRRSSGFEYQ